MGQAAGETPAYTGTGLGKPTAGRPVGCSKSGCRSSGSCSRMVSTGGGTGRPRYLARDSPGRTISSSALSTRERWGHGRWGDGFRSRGNRDHPAGMHILRAVDFVHPDRDDVHPAPPPLPPGRRRPPTATTSATAIAAAVCHGPASGRDHCRHVADSCAWDCSWEQNSAGLKRSIPADALRRPKLRNPVRSAAAAGSGLFAGSRNSAALYSDLAAGSSPIA